MAVLVCRLTLRDKAQPERHGAPDWKSAFLREAYLWGYSATLVTLAITLKERPLYIVLAISLLLQALSYLITRKRLSALR